MSPKKITKFASYLGVISLLGGVVMLSWQPQLGILTWWPLVGFALTGLLLAGAFLKGWMMSVEDRVAMNDAINLCHLGEEKQEEMQHSTASRGAR